jgi:predicted RNA-binding Zn-ribbon protein involved in translation (DUF1610 family)
MTDDKFICLVCNKKIKENDNTTICDSCGVEIHSNHLGQFNECPICGKEHTFKENF